MTAGTDERLRWRFRDVFDLVTLAATHGLSDGFSSLLVPVLVLIVADLGLSTFQAGLVLSTKSVATFLFMYPLSMLADATGRKKEILIVGMACAAAAYLSMRWAATFPAVAALAFVAGAGNAVYHPCGTALAAKRFSARRAVAISLHGLGGNIGTSLMPLAQSAIVAVADWRTAVAACALPAAGLLPLIGARFSASGTEHEERPHRQSGGLKLLTSTVLKNRNVVLLATVYALKGMSSKGLVGFLPLLAVDKFGMDTTAIGVAVSTYFTLGIVAKPVMGYLYNRWGARSALLAPLLLSGVLSLALGSTPWRWSFVPLAALLGAISPISPIILTATADLCDEQILASSVGFIYTCHGLGFLSPLIGGWLAERSGLSVSYVFFAAAVLAGAGVSATLPRRTRSDACPQ